MEQNSKGRAPEVGEYHDEKSSTTGRTQVRPLKIFFFFFLLKKIKNLKILQKKLTKIYYKTELTNARKEHQKVAQAHLVKKIEAAAWKKQALNM